MSSHKDRERSEESTLQCSATNRRRFLQHLSAGAASVGVVTLAGCLDGSSAGNTDGGGGEPAQIQMLNIQQTDTTEWFDQIATDVEEDTNYSISYEWITEEDFPTKLRTQYSGNNPPDAEIMDPHYMWSAATDGIIQSVDDKYDWEGNRDRFYQPLAYDSVTREVAGVGERKWGFPFGITSVSLFYYNQGFFENNGLDLPTTYSDLLDLKSEVPEGQAPLLFPAAERWWGTIVYMICLEQLSDNNTKEVMLDSVRGDRKFNDDIHVQALEMTERLAPHRDAIIGQRALDLNRTQAISEFVQGRGGPLFYTTTSALPQLLKAKPDDFQLRAMKPPYFDLKGVPESADRSPPAGFIGTITITEGTDNVDGVMEVVNRALKPELNKNVVEATGVPSPLKASNDAVDIQVTTDATEMLNSAHVYGNWWYPDQVENELQVATQELLRGETTPEDAANRAEQAMADIRGTDKDPLSE